MTDTELLQAIAAIIDEKLDDKLDKKLDQKLGPINNKLDNIEEKLNDMDSAIGLITDWIEKASDLNRIPFLEAK